MKKMNEILMKQVAETYEAVPPGYVWDNIERSLHENKKRRHFFFMLSTGLALVCISALIFFRGINTTNKTENDFNSAKTQAATTVLNEDSGKGDNIVIQQNPAEKKNETFFSIIENKNGQKENVNTAGRKELIEIIKEKSTSPEEISKVNTSIDIITINKIPNVLSSMQYHVFNPNFNDRIKCPDFGESGKKMFAELGLQGGYHLKPIGNGSNEMLADIRNISESEWYTWGFYGTVGLNITPNFYIGTGFDWTQSKDKFNHSSEAITKMIITFDPVTGIPTDTSFVTGKLITKGEIRYNSIDIPIVVGFVKNYDKWDFGMEISPVFNLNFSAKGKIFNDKMKISTIDKEPPVYRTGLGMGLKASLLIRRNIADGMYVQLKPTYKTYFNEINDENYPLPVRYNLFGINIGVRKDF